MSTWREHLEEGTGPRFAYEWLVAYYHYPVLVALVVFGFWTRTVAWGRFITQDTVLYSGNDPFYHLRSVQYVVANWPNTMPFDPWTNFPYGTSTAQFGTLFDQLIATAALVLGLGSPSEELVRMVVLFAPAVFGVLTFVPAYFIGRRLGGRFGGVLSVAILAFATGALYVQGWVGTSDHHVAEALFQAIGVLGVMVAISVAESEKPVYELLADREFRSIRQTLGWSVLAGVAVASYLWVWPPGVLLLGILGVFFVVYLIVEFLRGRSPEHVALAGAIAMATTAVLTLSTTHSLEISATSRSLLQPGLAFAVAVGCVFMAWLARAVEERDLPALAYPGAVVGLGVALAGLAAILAPNLYGFFETNVLRVVGLGYGTTAAAATVGEISPMPIGRLYESYGLAAFGALGGVILVVYRQAVDDEPHGQEVLVVVWLVFVLLASLTQQRFAYYLTIPIAGLNALLACILVGYANRTSSEDSVETYQVLTVAAILLVVLAPMAFFGTTAAGIAPQKGPGFVQGWQPSLDWLDENTPEPGQYANPDGEPMDYLGTFSRSDDFDYPNGAYGILSWWDYGHWITTNGHRIPNANPFQQGSNHAARFLLSGEEPAAMAELEDRDEDDAQTRYVMVDWQMAQMTSKGSAPIQFVENRTVPEFYSYLVDQSRLESGGSFNQAIVAVRHKQPYYDSMVNRLYHYHGSAVEPTPIVVDWQGNEERLSSGATFTFVQSQTGNGSGPIRQFETMEEARAFVEESPSTRQIGGIGTYPTERVPALEHFRLVHVSGFSGTQGGYSRTLAQTSPTGSAWTKTFERVHGATINGTGPANTTVRASVTLEPNEGQAFEYTQQAQTDESGAFSMRVPYATTGYDEWGTEQGYTNTSVRANGTYELTTPVETDGSTGTWYAAQVDVTEGQVLGLDESPASATLEEETFEFSDGADEGNTTGDGSGADTGGSGDGNETDGGDNDTTAPSGSIGSMVSDGRSPVAIEP